MQSFLETPSGAGVDQLSSRCQQRGKRGGIKQRLVRGRRLRRCIQGGGHSTFTNSQAQCQAALEGSSEIHGGVRPSDHGHGLGDTFVPGAEVHQDGVFATVLKGRGTIIYLNELIKDVSPRSGRDDGALDELPLYSRAPPLARREGNCCSHDVPAKSEPSFVHPIGQSLAHVEGLEESSPWWIKESLSNSSLGGNCGSARSATELEDGSGNVARGHRIPAGSGVDDSSARGLPASFNARSKLVEPEAAPSGPQSDEQNRRDGREHSAGYSSGDMARPNSAEVRTSRPKGAFGAERLPRVLPGISGVVSRPGPRCDSPLGDDAFRSVHRHCQKVQKPARMPKDRTVATQEEHEKVRAFRRAQQSMGGPYGKAASSFQHLRRGLEGRRFAAASAARADRPLEHGLGRFEEAESIRCNGKHGRCRFQKAMHIQLEGGAATRRAQRYPRALCQVFAEVLCNAVDFLRGSGTIFDIFGGRGGVGRACENLGHRALVVDLVNNNKDDVASLEFQSFFEHCCINGLVSGVCLATPCSSFSIAQSRAGRPIRSRAYPLGLDGLNHVEQLRVQTGNQLAMASIRIIDLCDKHGLPCILENPATSYLWHLPQLQPHIKNGRIVKFHQCAFKAPWRKHTQTLFINCGG